MGRTKLMKPVFEKDIVYLVHIPRAASIPSVSPFVLKLETWLRMANIPFENVDNNLTEQSSKGQIPFVELNGKELNDSNFIIDELMKYFNRESMESSLSPEQRANMHAYLRMVEESTRWAIVVDRSINGQWFANNNEGFGRALSCPKKFLLRPLGMWFLKRGLRGSAQKQGYGRFDKNELDTAITADLKALDVLIGKKPYFFGNSPTRLDASVFGMVAQFIYPPTTLTTVKEYIRTNCENLSAFMARVKFEYWPDWEEILATGSMSTNYSNQPVVRPPSNPAQDNTTKL